MFRKVRLRKRDGSGVVHLPEEVLERQHLHEAESVYLVETEDGIVITREDSTFGEALKVAARGAKKYRRALREMGGEDGVISRDAGDEDSTESR